MAIKIAKIKPIHIKPIKVDKTLNRKVSNTFKDVSKTIKKPVDVISKTAMTTITAPADILKAGTKAISSPILMPVLLIGGCIVLYVMVSKKTG